MGSSTINYSILTISISINPLKSKATKSLDPGLLLIPKEINFWQEKTTLLLLLQLLLTIKKPPPAKLTSLTRLSLMLIMLNIKPLEMIISLTKPLMMLLKIFILILSLLDLTLNISKTRTLIKMML